MSGGKNCDTICTKLDRLDTGAVNGSSYALKGVFTCRNGKIGAARDTLGCNETRWRLQRPIVSKDDIAVLYFA